MQPSIQFRFLFIAFFALSLASCKKKGCTNYYASNYSVEAKKDDGSCNIGTVPQVRGEKTNGILDTIVIVNGTESNFDLSYWYLGYEHDGITDLYTYQFTNNFFLGSEQAFKVPYSYFEIEPDPTTMIYLLDPTGLIRDKWPN
jgi:hypothetical protein